MLSTTSLHSAAATAPCEELELIQSFRCNPAGQHTELWNIIARASWAGVRSVLNNRASPEDLQDCVQDASIKAHLALLSGFQGRCKIATYIRHIAVNTARDFLRGRAGDPLAQTEDADELLVAVAAPSPPLELSEEIQLLVDALPDPTRRVMQRLRQGENFVAVAKSLGNSYDTLRAVMHRDLRPLLDHLRSSVQGDPNRARKLEEPGGVIFKRVALALGDYLP